MAKSERVSGTPPWKEIVIRDWKEFDDIVAGLPRNKWVYRGHADASWKLNTALYRTFKDALPIINSATNKTRRFARRKHERLLLKRFQATAHLYQHTLPGRDNDLEWLSIMQHYGAPTRLLDVTLSAHIASYFAMESGSADSDVIAFDHALLRAREKWSQAELRRKILSTNVAKQQPYVVLYNPKMKNERLLAQQGAFLVPSRIGKSFKSILSELPNSDRACLRIVIPGKLRLHGINRLREMNLTSAALFPGIDGFCRSMRFQVFEPVQSQALLG